MKTYSARFNGGKICTFQAADDDHAIVRAMATLIDSGRIGCRAAVWSEGGAVSQISFNNVAGGALTINDVSYDHETWRDSFHA